MQLGNVKNLDLYFKQTTFCLLYSLHGSTDISNINVYTLSEPLKKKKKKELSKVINDVCFYVSTQV